MTGLVQFLEQQLFEPSAFCGAIFYAVVFGSAAWGLGWLLKSIVYKAMERDHRGLVDRTAAPFIVQLIRAVIYVAAVLQYAHLIPELRGIGTALLAGASIASIVLGLAAQ